MAHEYLMVSIMWGFLSLDCADPQIQTNRMLAANIPIESLSTQFKERLEIEICPKKNMTKEYFKHTSILALSLVKPAKG